MDTYEDDENQEELVASSLELEANLPRVDADNMEFENPKEGNRMADEVPPSVCFPQIRSSDDLNGIKKSTKRRKARDKNKQEQIGEPKNSFDEMYVEVTQEQALDNSSNLGKGSRRGKRVCFNTSPIPTPITACTVPNTLGVQSIGEMKKQDIIYNFKKYFLEVI